MNGKLLLAVILTASLLLLGIAAHALTPSEVLVVYNTESSVASVSQTIAHYYANARDIPLTNVLGIETLTTESGPDTHYLQYIATPISNYLSTHPNIKCIVLCYGIPSRIIYQPNYDMSVDSALTLLGNPGVPNAQGEFARHWGLNLSNPFRGKNAGFDDFRGSAENAMQVTIDGQQVTWKLNYLVTRLDAFSEPTVNVNGVNIPRDVKAMIDRSTAATPGGNFVVDRSASDVNSVIQRFTSDGISTENIITNSTSVFLTGQQDVIGYWGEHMIIDGNANNYTTWTRPLHHWHNGIVYAQLFVKRR